MSSTFIPRPGSSIGVFDSGVGGLSVLKQISRSLPNESVVYFGDTAHVPYGGRPLEEVRGFALAICKFLVSHEVKMIVMACNISSAVAIDEARRLYPELPIIGVIEPGASAALTTGSERIGVLATQGTVTSGAYTRVIKDILPHATVVEVACPAFVPIVEAEEVTSPAAFESSSEYLKPIADARSKAVILGCTHYPFLLDTLIKTAEKLFPPNEQPVFIDPAVETADLAAAILGKNNLLNSSNDTGEVTYFVSGEPQHFQNNGSFFLGKDIRSVQQIQL